MADARALAALLQLASPALPVGAYSYSQGLEGAIHEGAVHDEASAREWIVDAVAGPLAHFDAPAIARMHAAWRDGDLETAARWNERVLATRETAELRAETLQMGASLAKLVVAWGRGPDALRRDVAALAEPTFPCAFAAAAVALDVAPEDAVVAFLWSAAENLVAAALKAGPFGQLAGQRILLAAHGAIDHAAAIASSIGDDDMWSSAPGLAILSSRHETQYSRLFRS
ncbi:Urease accessory protein UreF [Burkholderiales bacterium]|nr:Urease accessory protein UreF [Burkholderiales bacterium]